MIGLFTKAGRRKDAIARWSDETAESIEAASPSGRDEVRRQLTPIWVRRLADLLDEFPELEDELRSLTARVERELPAAGQVWVQSFVAKDRATQYNAPHGVIVVNDRRDVPPARQ